MKRLALFLWSAFAAVAASAASPAVKNIAVTLDLKADGSAVVTEVWDVTVTSGTEWYIVKENLGQIRIYDLAVKDELSPISAPGTSTGASNRKLTSAASYRRTTAASFAGVSAATATTVSPQLIR